MNHVECPSGSEPRGRLRNRGVYIRRKCGLSSPSLSTGITAQLEYCVALVRLAG